MQEVNAAMALEVSSRFRKDDPDGLEGLTPKQYRFATLRFSGMSNTDAYRAAYDCTGMAEFTVSKRASELANHPLVAAKVRELREQTDKQSTLSVALSRNFVLSGLMRLATTAEKESVQLGAYQTLGKTVGIDLFRETVVHETRSRTPEQVEAELKEKLDAMRAGLTIDGAARQVTPDAPKPPERRRRKAKT